MTREMRGRGQVSGDAELEMRRVSDEPHTGSGYSETSDTKHTREERCWADFRDWVMT